MNAIQNIKSRFSRKSAIGLTVFAIALTVSGVGSLAVLTDTATTVITASITSIDLTNNGTKAASIDFGQIEPGTVAYAPVTFHNAGSGYLNLSLSSTSNGSAVTNDSKFSYTVGIPAASCNSTDMGSLNEQYALAIAQPVLDMDPSSASDSRIVGASGTTGPNGDTITVCFIYRVGMSNGVGYGQTGFSTTLLASATHP